jgi:hypothetical protein
VRRQDEERLLHLSLESEPCDECEQAHRMGAHRNAAGRLSTRRCPGCFQRPLERIERQAMLEA